MAKEKKKTNTKRIEELENQLFAQKLLIDEMERQIKELSGRLGPVIGPLKINWPPQTYGDSTINIVDGTNITYSDHTVSSSGAIQGGSSL